MLAELIEKMNELRAQEEVLVDIYLASAGKENEALYDLVELRKELQVVENQVRMLMDI